MTEGFLQAPKPVETAPELSPSERLEALFAPEALVYGLPPLVWLALALVLWLALSDWRRRRRDARWLKHQRARGRSAPEALPRFKLPKGPRPRRVIGAPWSPPPKPTPPKPTASTPPISYKSLGSYTPAPPAPAAPKTPASPPRIRPVGSPYVGPAPVATPSAATHALIDGSNVMHWYVDAKLDAAPSLAPVQAVIAALKAEGRAAGVIFDASAGHRLFERYVHGPEFQALLPEAEDVYVVPKGEVADAYLLDYARENGLTIISNDHYRDHPEAADLPRRAGRVSGDKTAPKITLYTA